jgi:hypothetical protein
MFMQLCCAVKHPYLLLTFNKFRRRESRRKIMGCRWRIILVPLQTNTEEGEGFNKFEFADVRNCE